MRNGKTNKTPAAGKCDCNNMMTNDHQMETFSALLAICEEIHWSPVDSSHKGQWSGDRDTDDGDAITLIMTSL